MSKNGARTRKGIAANVAVDASKHGRPSGGPDESKLSKLSAQIDEVQARLKDALAALKGLISEDDYVTLERVYRTGCPQKCKVEITTKQKHDYLE